MTTVVYTDGACSGNPGPGGWAWAVPDGEFESGAEPHSTNQRMEITAVLRAVEALEGPLEVVSDSTYVVNCFRDRWWEGWIKRGWLNSQRKPVANRDLWEPLIEMVRTRQNVSFRWVKGHGGDLMNELVDRLAVEAAASQTGKAGSAPVSEPPLPGYPVAVLGDRDVRDDKLRLKLVEILRAKAELNPDLVVVTGLRFGAEILGAEASIECGTPFVVVLPYPHPEKVLNDEAQHRFQDLTDDALDVITLERTGPRSKQQAAEALARRDEWLARHVSEAILVWDGEDGRLVRLYRSLIDHLGDDVWLLDPRDLQ